MSVISERSRLRLLVLSTIPPRPVVQGDRVRLSGLLGALQALGTVSLALWGSSSELASSAANYFPLSVWSGALGGLRHLLVGRPVVTGVYSSRLPPLPGPWDLVVAFQLKTWRWASAIPASLKVLDMVDSTGLFLTSDRLPAAHRCRWLGVDSEERDAASHFTRVWVSGHRDVSYLHSLGVSNVDLVPNGPLRPVANALARPSARLLFVGNVRYRPNLDGLRWFLRFVWPSLHTQGYLLTLAGAGTEQFCRVEGVSALGQVSDIDPLYEDTALCISPVRWGTGSQSKIWEALGHNRQIVVTSFAGDTLGPLSGVVIADTPEEWIHAIVRVSRAPAPVPTPATLPDNYEKCLLPLLRRALREDYT